MLLLNVEDTHYPTVLCFPFFFKAEGGREEEPWLPDGLPRGNLSVTLPCVPSIIWGNHSSVVGTLLEPWEVSQCRRRDLHSALLLWSHHEACRWAGEILWWMQDSPCSGSLPTMGELFSTPSLASQWKGEYQVCCLARLLESVQSCIHGRIVPHMPPRGTVGEWGGSCASDVM